MNRQIKFEVQEADEIIEFDLSVDFEKEDNSFNYLGGCEKVTRNIPSDIEGSVTIFDNDGNEKEKLSFDNLHFSFGYLSEEKIKYAKRLISIAHENIYRILNENH